MYARLIAAAAVAALMSTSALAQTSDMPAKTADSGGGIASVTQQSSDQWLASKLIGTNVYNASSEKIGSVNDVLLDKSGQPIAAILGVGGFLGIGEKKGAGELKSLQLMRSSDGDKVMAQTTKDQLLAAADFKVYVPPAPTPPTANRAPIGAPPAGGPRQ